LLALVALTMMKKTESTLDQSSVSLLVSSLRASLSAYFLGFCGIGG